MKIPVTPTNTSALLVGLMRNSATAESREYISDMQMQINSAHRLASLILSHADALRLVLPNDRAEILRLARLLVPDAQEQHFSLEPIKSGIYTLEHSPAQTGEAGVGTFAQVIAPPRICPHDVDLDTAICSACYPKEIP